MTQPNYGAAAALSGAADVRRAVARTIRRHGRSRWPGCASLLSLVNMAATRCTRMPTTHAHAIYGVTSKSANEGTGNGGSVTVYAPGGKRVLRKITAGISFPFALAFDGSDNLYVADYPDCADCTNSSVTVCAWGSTSVLRTITAGINSPIALAFAP